MKFYPVKAMNDFLISSLKTNFTDMQGSKMYLNKLFREVSHAGIWEPFETKIVKKLVQRGDIVIDIGANIGYFTLLFSRLVKPSGKVFAFEPEPANFSLLKKNIEVNGYKNVTLIQKAVSNKNELIKLYLSQDNEGDHRIYESDGNRDFIEIESVCLDEYFRNMEDKINFVKMDIQGAEGTTIQGMKNILNRNDNLNMITEYWPYGLIRCGMDPLVFPKLLVRYNYYPFELNEKDEKIELTDIDKLKSRYKNRIEDYTNILWLKDSKIGEKLNLK